MRLLCAAALTAAGLLLLCLDSANAQGGVPLWTNRYNGPIYSDNSAVAVDWSGNVFVTGPSRNGSNEDYATIKYSNTGVPLWTNRYDGPANGYDIPRAIAIDSTGNVFVTGYSWNGSDEDYVTIAYSSAGIPLWTNRYNGPENGNDGAVRIAADSSGDVFVTGYSRGGGDYDYVTIKYANDGAPLWTNRFIEGGRYYEAYGIAVDNSGNVFVTGYPVTIGYSGAGTPLWTNYSDISPAGAMAVDSSGNVFVTGFSWNGSNYDYATIKYSGAGVPLWTNRYAGTGGDDFPEAIAVDSSGNVFVTGSSGGNGSLGDYATIKYSNTGVPLWTNRYNGPANSSDFAVAIVVDSSGNVFVTGSSEGRGSDEDYATIAYSNSGIPLWTNRYTGPGNGNDRASAIAIDRNGNVFVTGFSWNGTNIDYVTFKYSSSVPPPRLDFQKVNNQLVLSWTNAGFNLQSAPTLTGPFNNIPASTSPYTNSLTAPQQFFRLKGN